MGCPSWLIKAVKALYVGSSVCLSLGFTEGEGFDLSSGIKQGCPMSGDIWCLIFDPFIRALIDGLGDLDALVTAFAGDLGIPCSDLLAVLRALLPIVDLMKAAAGLSLNWKKTVFVNFSVYSEFELRRRIEQMFPVATTAKISEFARYLGFITGPLAHLQSWGRPYKRVLERARHVRSLGLSLFECVLAFNVFVVSLLSFHFQLAPVCDFILGGFRLALDVATGTPRHSLGINVLCRLRRLGFPAEIQDVEAIARAAAYRTARRSEVFSHLLSMQLDAESSDEAALVQRHRTWRENSPMAFLRRIVSEVEKIPGVVQLPVVNLQRRMTKLLKGGRSDEPLEDILTDRIRYFGFRAPREMAGRFIKNLSDLAHFVQPFVLAAVLKTVCNAWPTARRFRTSVGNECKLGCGAELGDDVVHYPFCPVVAEFVRDQGGPSVPLFLRLRSLSHYMLLHYVNIEDLFITAILQDVIFQATNARRSNNNLGTGKGSLFSRLRTVYTKIPATRKALRGESLLR